MKNSNLFLLVAALFAFVSCGTANLTAQWGASQYRNGIYFSAASANVQSAPAQVYSDYVVAEPEVVESQTVVQPVSPVLANGESYEDLLRKFDSPVYVVNVDYVDIYPWWSMNFSWMGPSWRWNHSWYARPYWGSPYWSSSYWYAHWYPGSYWDWYWADSWWHNHYWHNHYWHPHYRPIYNPPHHRPHQPMRDVYYGKRNYAPSYRDMNRNRVTVGSKSPLGTQSGSVTRRATDVRGNGAVLHGQPAGQQGKQGQQGVQGQQGKQGQQGVQGQQGKQGQQGQPQYRRTAGKSGSTAVKSAETEKTKTTQTTQRQQSSSQNEYRRSSSGSSSQQFNRSGSSSAPSRSSYSNQGGGSRSGGSSGSYRRR